MNPNATSDGIDIYCSYRSLTPTADLQPHPMNPNTHPDSQILLLGEVLKKQGWRAPVTVSNLSGKIVRGEGRYLAALKMGWKDVPVDCQDYNSQDEETADLLADNKLADLSYIDEAMLQEIMATIENTELTGYSQKEVDDILNSITKELPTQDFSSKEVDASKFDEDNFSHQCPRCDFLFND